MLAVQLPLMGFGHKPKTTLGYGYMTKTKTLDCGFNNNNNNKKRRIREDVEESKTKRLKTITSLSATSPSKESLGLAISRAQQALLKKKREAARVSLLAMEKEIDIQEDNLETFKQLRMLCGGREVVMGSFNLHQFGVDLVLKKDKEEEEECCGVLKKDKECSGLYHLSAIKTPSSPSKESLCLVIKRAKQALLKKKREAARVSLLSMEKEVDIQEDNLETFKELRMICGGREVVMGSFNLQRFGVDLVLKKEEEEDEEQWH